MEQVLLPLSRGESTLRYQRYDWETRRLAEWMEVVPGPYLIIEGVSSSRLQFAPYVSFAIWAETDRDERLRRGVEDMTGYWLRWMAEEDAYVLRESPQERADLVVGGDKPTP